MEQEIRYQSRWFSQHTCMAVWGGNNGLEPALGRVPEPRENPICYAVDFADTFLKLSPVLQVEEEVRYQSRRLNQYTCMAVWGGNNELEPALGWFPESRDDPICYALNFC